MPSSTPVSTPSSAPETRVVYLTFDDGPNRDTGKILDILDNYDVKATFFVCGYRMEENPDTLRRIVGSGHSIGLHCYTHDESLMYASPDTLIDEINRSNELLFELTGVKTRIFRFPWGSSHKAVTAEMRERVVTEGYRYWDWTEDALDYTSSTEYVLANNVVRGIAGKKKEVVLMHDTERTAAALPTILEYIESNNYVVETITQSEMPINSYKDVR